MQLHLVLICIEVIYGVFRFVKRFVMRFSKLYRKREVQHPGCDWSSAFYRFLHMAELLLDVPEPLLPRLLPCLLLIKDVPIASVIPTIPLLIAILSRGLVRVMLPGLASFSFSICFSRMVEVLLFFLGNGVLAFSGLSPLLGALYLPSELL